MITYKLCSEVNIDDIFQAFKLGFSDYLIPIKISKEAFIKKFFEVEGNELKYSYIAMDEGKAVGLILGGIKNYEGVKTLRCGALCVNPEYRGKGISNRLFELHREIGVQNNCKQLFLEVIVGNDRAIRFYEKYGYEKLYDLFYYSHKKPYEIKGKGNQSYTIKNIHIDEIRKLREEFIDIHINWQNDVEYIEKLENQLFYGVYDRDRLIGALSGGPEGKIYYLWVSPKYRNKGIGTNLIIHYIENSKPDALYMSFSNNRTLQAFAQRHNFTKDIMQYEMYLNL